jgi:hypothetical protein
MTEVPYPKKEYPDYEMPIQEQILIQIKGAHRFLRRRRWVAIRREYPTERIGRERDSLLGHSEPGSPRMVK